jgi:hypothetical protein
MCWARVCLHAWRLECCCCFHTNSGCACTPMRCALPPKGWLGWRQLYWPSFGMLCMVSAWRVPVCHPPHMTQLLRITGKPCLAVLCVCVCYGAAGCCAIAPKQQRRCMLVSVYNHVLWRRANFARWTACWTACCHLFLVNPGFKTVDM